MIGKAELLDIAAKLGLSRDWKPSYFSDYSPPTISN
jgi:hypothetical protein